VSARYLLSYAPSKYMRSPGLAFLGGSMISMPPSFPSFDVACDAYVVSEDKSQATSHPRIGPWQSFLRPACLQASDCTRDIQSITGQTSMTKIKHLLPRPTTCLASARWVYSSRDLRRLSEDQSPRRYQFAAETCQSSLLIYSSKLNSPRRKVHQHQGAS